MTKVRTLTLCLIAAFVVAALAATTASAEKLPVWGKCEPTEHSTGGKYADAGCTVPVKKVNHNYPGGYEWYPSENSEERSSGESKIHFNRHFAQPVPTVTITLGHGLTITCRQGRTEQDEEEEDVFALGGSGGRTVGTPFLEFRACADNQPAEEEIEKECHTTDAEEGGEIVDETAFESWLHKEPGAWLGSMAFLEGKNTFAPKVALEWKTEEPRRAVFQQLDCANEPNPYTINIGGGTRNEAVVAQIEPLNQMSASFTTHLSPALPSPKGTKPLEAQVNLGAWEPIGIEATMVFTEVVATSENNESEMELKATA
jgi:hypothetical protein